MNKLDKSKTSFKPIFAKILKVVMLSALVSLIAIIFISKKANLDIDEMYTYGLSNNQFQVDVIDFKEYTGERLFLDYVAASDSHSFDIKNVFFNQKMDTHPPLYFILINFICSINKGNFSMMYGLIINILFLIILYWETRHLISLITDNKVFATTIPFLALASYAYINNYTFTRMYVMLSAISMALVIVILDYIAGRKIINLKFLLKFYLICLLGVLTHYHFVIIAFIFSIILAITLILRKQIRELMLVFASGSLSIISALAIFPSAIDHIFSKSESTHALTNISTNVNIISNLATLSRGLINSFFGYGIILYVLLLIIGLAIFFSRKKDDINPPICNMKLYLILTVCSMFYFLSICFTVRLSFHRYLYNIYPLIIILVSTPLYYLYCRINKNFILLIIIAMCIFNATSLYNNSPTSLNAEDALFDDYLYENKATKTICLYRSIDSNGIKNSINTSLWKLPAPLYLFRNIESLTYIDISNEDILSADSNYPSLNYNDLFLVIYTSEDDDQLINAVMKKYNLNDYQRIYFTTYFHVYRLK